MSDMAQKTDQLAELVEEFGLESATWKGDGWRVSLGPSGKSAPVFSASPPEAGPPSRERKAKREPKVALPEEPQGKPITSPMMGIYYGSPNPGSPSFVTPGKTVSSGDVVCLIEAMKVFNEIQSPFTGRVLKVVAESGQLVQPGDVLVLIE
jgi:acetyl-CoA carboxylase biotin carboxyl carrier protein